MTVDSFSDKLSAYIDGELPEADRVEMENMIAEIPACSAMYENMVLLQERLGDLPEFQPSAEFEFGLRSQLLLEAAKETRLRHKVKQVLFPTVGRSVLSGAIAATLAMGVSILLQGEPVGDVTASQVAPSGIESAPLGRATRSRTGDPILWCDERACCDRPGSAGRQRCFEAIVPRGVICVVQSTLPGADRFTAFKVCNGPEDAPCCSAWQSTARSRLFLDSCDWIVSVDA
jgi:hypothetical protein